MNTNTLERTEPAIAAAGQSLDTVDLERARLYLELTSNYVIGATKGLSDTQWNFKPTPDRWSIAQNVEHMVFVQDLVLGPIREQLAMAPPPPANRDYKLVDGIVVHEFPDRLNKFNPDIQQPRGEWAPAFAVDRLLKNYERFSAYLESTPDLRQHMVEARPLKAVSKGKYEHMDGYQWVLAAAAHNERHTKQILEVKADPNFPAA
jgi:hypothetical protein